MSQAGSFSTGGGPFPPGVLETLTGDTGGPVPATANNIDVLGGENMNTAGNPGISTLFINLNETIHWPDTNGAGTTGVIYLGAIGAVGGNRFMHNFGFQNTYLGENAGNFTGIGIFNVGIGTNALNAQTAASSNVAIGHNSLPVLNTGGFNVAIGHASLESYTDGQSNISIGDQSLQLLLTGQNNIAIGDDAGISYTSTESDNILLANVGVVGESGTIRIGTTAVQTNCYISGIYANTVGATKGTVIIDNTGKLGTVTGTPATSFPTDAGTATPAAGVLDILGGENINTSGATNVVTINLNESIRLPNSTADGLHGVIFLGAIGGVGGTEFLHNYSTLGNSTFCGFDAGNFTNTAAENSGFGTLTLNSIAAGEANTACGSAALTSLTGGFNNSAFGDASLFNLHLGNINTSSYNTALGCLTGLNLLTGAYNTLIGSGDGTTVKAGGQNYTGTESSNIIINNGGVIGDNNTIRIGVAGAGVGQVNKCFIAGIFGITIGGTGIPVNVDNAGQLGTVVSARRFKKNIERMSDEESAPIMKLKPVTFQMKSDGPECKERRIGLIAEEVEEHIPSLVLYDEDNQPFTVKYNDLPVLLLNELQKQNCIINSLLRRINLLENNYGSYVDEL